MPQQPPPKALTRAQKAEVERRFREDITAYALKLRNQIGRDLAAAKLGSQADTANVLIRAICTEIIRHQEALHNASTGTDTSKTLNELHNADSHWFDGCGQ